jgi:hypothetical protein
MYIPSYNEKFSKYLQLLFSNNDFHGVVKECLEFLNKNQGSPSIFNFLDKIEMNVDIKPLIDDLLKLYRFCYENPFSIKNINISCFDKNNNIIYSFEYDFLNVYLDLNYIENITYIFYNLQNKLINNIENNKNIENII